MIIISFPQYKLLLSSILTSLTWLLTVHSSIPVVSTACCRGIKVACEQFRVLVIAPDIVHEDWTRPLTE